MHTVPVKSVDTPFDLVFLYFCYLKFHVLMIACHFSLISCAFLKEIWITSYKNRLYVFLTGFLLFDILKCIKNTRNSI